MKSAQAMPKESHFFLGWTNPTGNSVFLNWDSKIQSFSRIKVSSFLDSFLSSFDFLRYSKMISDFKVKNRSPPLKKKYQLLGIYQMHWHIASQVSKALYHKSKSPYSGQASHRPWAYPWRHHLTFWQEGAFTIWAEGLSHWDDMIAIQALALKNSWSKERRLGWDGNSIRQLWSKRVGCGLLLRKNSSTLLRFLWSFLRHYSLLA